VGRLVTVELSDVAGGTVTGRIADADESGVRIDVDGTMHAEPWSRIGRGRVQVEFNRADDTHADAAGEGA
jgi:ribosome maturation factor RimP